MHETRTLAAFVVDTQFADLPSSVVEECRMAVLDTLGAGFVGSVQPWARLVIEMVRELGGTPEVSVIHQPWQTDIARAALANGAMIGAFECEPLTGSHAYGTVLPAVLAVCEREHCDGKTLLTALVLGCEVSARIARTAVGLETVRGFHNPGTQGPFAASAAVAKLYECSVEVLTSALGIAGSSSAGLLEFAWSGADTKRLHVGRASQLGLESALLARKGLRGPATVLEGRYGYYNAFSQPPDMRLLLDGLGTHWAIQPPSLKSYATHVTHQGVVQAIQELQREHMLPPHAMTRLAIRGVPRIMEPRHVVRDPETVMGGQYSLPFTAAVALTRDLSDPLVYNDQAIRDPVVRDLAQRIELIPVEEMAHAGADRLQAEVLIESAGQTYTRQTRPYKGSPQNPFTWDEVCGKFRRFTADIIRSHQATAIIEAVSRLDQLTDATDLTQHLSVSE